MSAQPMRQARIALLVAVLGVTIGFVAMLLGQEEWAEWADLGNEGMPPGWVAVSLLAFATAAIAFIWFLLCGWGSSGTPEADATARPARAPRQGRERIER